MSESGHIKAFMKEHFLHFNSAVVVQASEAYEQHLANGDKMMITLAGAMSTAELGKSLAEMIRQDKVHIISCTGANLEEDIFNLVAHSHYKQVPHYRFLSAEEEMELCNQGLNRVTDTCIPEEEAFRKLETILVNTWKEAVEAGTQHLPHEFYYQILNSGVLESEFEIDPNDSWLLAAAEKNLPIVVPGWEDSTTGNFFAAHCMHGNITPDILKPGVEYMRFLADWYVSESKNHRIGFFQIGGGIAGDFPICVVPMLHQDLRMDNVPVWSYFAQISDSTTSYGSYSGAEPNEKITWGKLEPESPKFIIESDATIVAPLIFAWLLDW